MNKTAKKLSTKSDKRAADLIRQVTKTILQEKLIEKDDKVLLAISGGIDSTTLLFVLLEIQKNIGFDLGLAHINHMLRGKESERDEEFIKKLALRLRLQLYVKRVDVKKIALDRGLSIQHAGREARYHFFNEVITEYGYNKIAVAHNLDDQIETFLLRALKGTGLKGLSAIPIKRDAIIRPFLNTYRADITQYAGRQIISFVEDSSNDKIVYERNFLRKEIFPIMEKLNPLFKEKIFFLLKDLTYIDHLFEKKANAFLKKHQRNKEGDISLDINSLNKIDDETKFRVISDIIVSLEPAFVPLREHIRQIKNIISAKGPNLVATLPKGIKIKKIYDHLLFTKKPPASPIQETFPLSMGKNVLQPFGLDLQLSQPRKIARLFSKNKNIALFDSDKLGQLTIRTFINGDTFIPLGMKGRMKLKDFFISLKVPKEERRTIPLLLSDNDIIWIIGSRIDERFKITKNTSKVLKVTATPFK
ncbi:MAG: tilS [Deltaproteobacteria bacterium]|nr:tilS [Deltaproteobacteria bacterium]